MWGNQPEELLRRRAEREGTAFFMLIVDFLTDTIT